MKSNIFILGLFLFFACGNEPKEEIIRTKLLLGFEAGMSDLQAKKHYNLLVKKGIIKEVKNVHSPFGEYVMKKFPDGRNIEGRIELKYDKEYLTEVILHIGSFNQDSYDIAYIVDRLKTLLSQKYEFKGTHSILEGSIFLHTWEKGELIIFVTSDIEMRKIKLLYKEKGNKELEGVNSY